MSIACWIVVYTPQSVSCLQTTRRAGRRLTLATVWENYNLKSGEGLSVAFIVLWLAGDLTNLAGGAMAHLLPTMIILAFYVSSSALPTSEKPLGLWKSIRPSIRTRSRDA
jgi:hypothetical protein